MQNYVYQVYVLKEDHQVETIIDIISLHKSVCQ